MSVGAFIGRATVDIISLVSEFPKQDQKITAEMMVTVPGGPALNAAVTFSALGSKAIFAGRIGEENLWSNIIQRDLLENSVEVFDFSVDSAFEPPKSQIISDRKHATRCVINDRVSSPSSTKKIDWNIAPDIILLDQFEPEFFIENMEYLKLVNCPIVIDGGSIKPQTEAFLNVADIAVVSKKFADQIEQAGERLFDYFDRFQIKAWAVTLGENGVRYHHDDQDGNLPASKVHAIDTLGAGDIFHGAFCHSYVKENNFLRALEFANEIAGRSCESVGTRAWIEEYKVGQ